MKVLTLNTHSWLEENQEEKMQRLAKKIAEESFDVIALQEVNQTAESNQVTSPFSFTQPAMAQIIKEDNFALKLVTYLNEVYNLTYYWSWAYNHIGFDKYNEGVALLSKYPLKEVTTYSLSKATDPLDYHTRVALGATIDIHDKQAYHFISLHASWWERENKKYFPYEARQLQKIKENQALPVIIMGDFNNPCQKENEGYDLLLEQWFDSYQLAKETKGEYTMGGYIAGWDASTPPLRIDFIFLSNEEPIKKAVICFDGKDEPVISDHFAYFIETE